MDAHNGGDAAAAGIALVAMLVQLVITLVLVILVVAGLWKMFEKAGKPGWAAIVPIYNVIVMLEIIGKPVWWVILFLIPCVNFIVSILVYIELAKAFGKDAIWGIGMVIFPYIFFPILGFGSAKYVGPAGVKSF